MILNVQLAEKNMSDLFALTFFKNAFLMIFFLGLLYGLLSFFVVMRKMTFLGAGIAHTAFGGIALGIFLGIQPFYVSLIFCVIAALLIGKLIKYGNISYDSGIGIFFSFSMALGAILIALRKTYSFDLSGYLFGNILGITSWDLIMVFITFILFIPFILFFLNRILFMTFDERVATISGVKTETLDTILLVFLAGIVVVSIKAVGIILVSALVVLPASFGLLLSKDFRKVIYLGMIYAITMMIAGLFLSYYLDTPAGATMVVLASLFYFCGAAIKGIKVKYD
jgi:ABC-type Mn2+/Zn2+ transport system permease subunit